MLKGIIYKYESPSNKVYIGQTVGYKWKYIPKDKGSTTNEKLSIIDRTE